MDAGPDTREVAGPGPATGPDTHEAAGPVPRAAAGPDPRPVATRPVGYWLPLYFSLLYRPTVQ